jgi:hypothetical protein
MDKTILSKNNNSSPGGGDTFYFQVLKKYHKIFGPSPLADL